jgi:PmbA protein
LVDRLGTSVASPLVTILDDSTLVRGPGSRLFDGEGFASRRLAVVERGVLQAYLLDSYCGRKLKLQSNASAGRGGNGAVSVSTSNFVLQPGSTAPADIVAGTSSGLLVTDLMGFGFNPVTGDFSRGASGFWVENGAIAFAVNEVTISLNLHDLLSNIDLVGSELDMRSSVCCPMFRVSSMTIAGSQ